MPQSKEEKKAYIKKWREEHREEQKASNKKWREEHPEYSKKWREEHREEQKAYKKKWYEENKEKVNAKSKQWQEEHKEEVKAQKKKWREEHKEERKAQTKIYYQTDAGKKSNRISNWKQRGILSDDYDALYDKYLNTKNCEECGVELVEGQSKNSRCLDHDHSSGLFRNVLCNSCNVKRK